MGEDLSEPEENVSKMFTEKDKTFTLDEELALQIIHKFNISCLFIIVCIFP